MVLGSLKILTIFLQSKYNKHFKEVLTVVNPVEKGSGDIAAGSGLVLSRCWGWRNYCVCAEMRRAEFIRTVTYKAVGGM